MEGNVWRPTHLTSEQMDERRLAAATLLRQGQLSQADIARHVGGSRASACRWAATLLWFSVAGGQQAGDLALGLCTLFLDGLAPRYFRPFA
jgi:hypothetical protein